MAAGGAKRSQVVDEIALDADGTPNSFNRRDLVQGLLSLAEDQVYYLVYLRTKTQQERHNEMIVSHIS